MDNWQNLNTRLPTLTEDELKAAIEREQNDLGRARFLMRMHQRYTKLRALRERVALMRTAKAL